VLLSLCQQAKHGARASSSDMQTANGAFTGVVLCRYCSTDAAARAVSQLSNSVVEGHTLKAVYNVAGGDAGTGGGAGGNNAVASAAPTPPHAQRPRGNSRDGSRLIMVPAVPHTGRVRSRSRGFSEDWSSRRSAEKVRVRHVFFCWSGGRGVVVQGAECHCHVTVRRSPHHRCLACACWVVTCVGLLSHTQFRKGSFSGSVVSEAYVVASACHALRRRCSSCVVLPLHHNVWPASRVPCVPQVGGQSVLVAQAPLPVTEQRRCRAGALCCRSGRFCWV